MKYRKFIGAVMIAGALSATLAACGGDDDSSPLGGPATASESEANGDGGGNGTDPLTDPTQRPSVEALNDMLNSALDPNVPNEDKTELVENSDRDPEIFDKLVEARQANPDIDYRLLEPIVNAGPNRATVNVEISLPDSPPQNMQAQIVFDNGRWKLASSSVCPLLMAQEIESPMCEAAQ